MSQPTGGRQSTAPPGPPISPGPRESNASSLPRPSQSQAPGDLCRLDTIYSPSATSGLRPNVDIVAVHGLSEDADSTWVFTLPARTKGGSGSAPGKRDSSFIPTVESIKETGVVVSNIAGNFVKDTVTTAVKPFSNQPQQPADAQFGQRPIGETPRQDESRAKPPHAQSSNASSISDDPESGPTLPAKVNWLKDNNMLPSGNTFSRVESGIFTAANKDALKVEIKVPEAPCSEDPRYLLVKGIIKDNINFTTTRRLWDAISTRDEAEVKTQISKGADVNRENSREQNALHLATEAGDLNIVKLLLEKNVEVNAKDMGLQSPIRHALLKSNYDIVRALLKRGALADDEDKKIASDMDARHASDKSFRALLDNVAYFEGPRVRPKKQESLPKSDQDNVPEDCRSAAGKFRATITTFNLRCENDSEDKIRDVAPPDAGEESSIDEDEREYHIVETLPLSDLLYSEAGQDQKNNKPCKKEWKWYHLPANNMDWVEPQASVLKGNDRKDTVLFMPYLHFETNEGRIRLSNAIKRTAIDLAKPQKEDDATSVSAESDCGASTKALFTYDDDDLSESESDGDDIKEMVDPKVKQLKGTLITSFPQGWGRANGPKDDCDGVLEQIQCYLRKPIRNPITSVDALASVIIKECTRVFGRFQVPKPELQFLDFFDASISDVADRHSKIYAKLDVGWDDEEDFGKTGQKNQEDKSKKEKKKERKKAKQKAKPKRGLKGSQLHINQEVELLVEIQDIRDELNIIKRVLDDQHSVLTVPDSEDNRKSAKSKKHILHATFPDVDGKAVDSHVNVNRNTIEHMISRAGDVSNAIYHLIDLKQKQANITEARYARKEAKSAAKEGRTILALTIVNMIFLPLSFMASFFSLDIAEFPKDPETGQTTLHLRWVAQYVFGISLAIAIPSIAVALAIGPMADFTKNLGRRLAYVLSLIAAVLFAVLMVALAVALVPVAIAACGVGLAIFILYLVAFIVFDMCRWIWRCTPWYRSREARKRREGLDPEVAVQNEGRESQVDGNNRNGEGEGDEEVDEKGTKVKERGPESQHDAGNGYEIEEAPQPTLI
ncbi:hypothetical protein DL767_006894 [Monosporascus sp. MG133]|nr:hypothetical protein DL767_006894 [Monosporascus sp. MG133]